MRTTSPGLRDGNSSTTSDGDFVNPQYGHVHALWSAGTYGRRVSSAMENRAAVFTSQPQVVEVYQAGAWWPGELLGWRHEADGTCQVRVRVVLGGVEESAWTDLATLRLPERHMSLPSEAAPATPRGGAVAGTRSIPTGSGPGVAHDPSETAHLPLLRDRSVPASRGLATSSRTGGRRRAPETGPLSAVPMAPSPSAPAPSVAASGAPRGRHRAPADPGRHRAADTGMLPAVSARPAASDVPTPRSSRLGESFGAPVQDPWSATRDPEPELLTRPMRLTDAAPHSRRPRLDGSLAGV